MVASAGSQFWGKYQEKSGKSLSLLAHSLDVAVVFRALCGLNGIRRTLASSTETLLTDEHLDRLATLAMLHDIGKANLGFQDKILQRRPTRVGHIRELGPLFGDEELRGMLLRSLPRDIGTWFSSVASADSYFFAIFSHHGRPALEAGARVLVVMNTVRRAISMLRAIEANCAIDSSWLFRCNDRVCAHHGRFAPEDRAVLDKAVSARLGKNSAPGPVLLVGTQTLEQSLDIDADLLVTDLAPSDVLLQRVGRLHRHNRIRPLGYGDARCVVLAPDRDLETALDSRGEVSGDFKRIGYGSVYGPRQSTVGKKS